MKKSCLLLAIVVFFVASSTCDKTYANQNNTDVKKPILSELSRKEIIEFLKQNDIDVQEPYLTSAIDLIPYIEKYPEAGSAVSNPILIEIEEKVRNAVLDYYEIDLDKCDDCGIYINRVCINIAYPGTSCGMPRSIYCLPE